MSNPYLETPIVDKAIAFAVKAHRNSERRGEGIPYILHPLEAMIIVSTMSKDQELMAAAVLHDTLEDTDVTFEDIKKEFGDRIATIVQNETVIDDGSKTWKERKQLTIDRVKAASLDSKIVALGDKLSNIRSIYRDYLEIGDKLWERFHTHDPKEIGWYYNSMLEAFIELKDTNAYKEFEELIKKTFK